MNGPVVKVGGTSCLSMMIIIDWLDDDEEEEKEIQIVEMESHSYFSGRSRNNKNCKILSRKMFCSCDIRSAG